MKKVFVILGLSLILAACGNGKSGSSSSADSTAAANKTAVATNSDAAQDTAASHNGTEKTAGTPTAAGAQLIAKADCLGCHKEQEKLIGPAYADVAKKYTASPAVIDTLCKKIINGGKGNWGDVPMSAHASLSMDDARIMVKYILSLKK
jgi:cytochrome c